MAQGLTLPGHLGSMPTAMAAIGAAFAGDIGDGDVFILNDPFQGGMHLPDVFVFKPIFTPTLPSPARGGGNGRGRAVLLAWAATVCHHTDVGGRVPGSNASDSTEIYQEGLRIPPLKLYDRGKRNDTLFALIETQCAGAGQGVRRSARATRRLPHRRGSRCATGGAATAAKSSGVYMTELIDYAERMTRAAIRELPDGVYELSRSYRR